MKQHTADDRPIPLDYRTPDARPAADPFVRGATRVAVGLTLAWPLLVLAVVSEGALTGAFDPYLPVVVRWLPFGGILASAIALPGRRAVPCFVFNMLYGVLVVFYSIVASFPIC